MKAITRKEKIMSGENLTPITRKEMFLAKAAGQNVETPEPATREEMFLSKISGGSGGVPINNQDKTITENGVYQADEGYTGLGTVTVEVASTGGGDIDVVVFEEMNQYYYPTKIFINTAIIPPAWYKSKSSITDIRFGDNVVAIKDDAFDKCTSLSNIIFSENCTEIGQRAFQTCMSIGHIKLPDELKQVTGYCFSGCNNMTMDALPSAITKISFYGFNACSKLNIQIIPAGVLFLESNAFGNCTSLTNLTFKGKPSTIDSSAFYGCTNLTTINVPWAEGEVANAPWGATNATINYNYTGE